MFNKTKEKLLCKNTLIDAIEPMSGKQAKLVTAVLQKIKRGFLYQSYTSLNNVSHTVWMGLTVEAIYIKKLRQKFSDEYWGRESIRRISGTEYLFTFKKVLQCFSNFIFVHGKIEIFPSH